MENISPGLKSLFEIACNSGSTVLLTGNTGTGKSCLARQIHLRSRRSQKPFVVVNLATLHAGVLESELFGHERGSFTGADQRRKGRLEMADGGTVFLDEVGELPLHLQARLLDFLQSRCIFPVGSNREIQLDVRVIAATHRDLVYAVKNREFREDLFHRLRVISIPLKTLRERYDEFDDLVYFILKKLSLELDRPILKLSSAVIEVFKAYQWPGNIRELRNVLEYALLTSNGAEIHIKDLPHWMNEDSEFRTFQASSVPFLPVLGESSGVLDFYGAIGRFEKEYLSVALVRNGGRINRTAQQIGLNKASLLRRIKTYNIDVSIYN